MSLRNLFLSTRPWSFTASFIPSLLGFILAKEKGHFSRTNLLITFFSLMTVILVHAAGNLVNTYYDYINGVDAKVKKNEDKKETTPNEIRPGDTTLTENIVTIKQLLKLLLTCYLASFITFILLLTLSPASSEIIILLYVLGLASSYFYTGDGGSLKYKALGDLVILLTFGPLISEFVFTSCCGYLSMTPIFISLPLAISAESILHTNNMRDVESDRKAGIHTLVMYLGAKLSGVTMVILLAVPYVCCVVFSLYTRSWIFLLPCLAVGNAAEIYGFVRSSRFRSLPEKVAKYHLIFGTLYVIAVYFSNVGPFV